MNNWIAVSPTQLGTKHYIPRHGYLFASDMQVVPILLAELAKLIPYYVLAFIHQDNTYQPVALTGLGDGRNMYVLQDGKWLGTYVPAFLRSHPFRLLTSENKQRVLCIHEDHLTEDSQGQPLFDQDGNPTQPVQDTLNFLNDCEKNRKVTQAACAALDQAGVNEKWPLQLKREEGQDPIRVEGLYKISEKALNELDVETFAGLRSNGALGLAYAQIFSMNQINHLTELAKYHAKLQQKANINPEEIFGDDDKISFDNI